MKKTVSLSAALFLIAGMLSCESKPAPLMTAFQPSVPPEPRRASGGGKARTAIKFNEDARTNAKVDQAALDLTFVDRNGKPVALKDYRDKKNVVLVVTRGYAGAIDPYCSAQTTRLIIKYQDFKDRDAEVLLVFPGPKEQLPAFISRAERGAEFDEVAFPVLLDEKLDAVNKLGIRGDLAKPSTYIIDKQGKIRFAYVGAKNDDRPSVNVLLNQLDEIDKN
jgi:peroxiredoxin